MQSTRLVLGDRFFGQNISLDDKATESGRPVWLQVAEEGVYKGYHDGPIALDAEFLNALVKNLHAHPSFRAGPDGFGSAPVIPFDYEHTSELGPMVPGIMQSGAPAIAWALDLQVRRGAGGKLQLWALVSLGDRLRQQIRSGEYRWTSIAAARDAVDKVSGKKIGPVLTSIAVTNRPFIEGMQPMAANAGGGAALEAAVNTPLGRLTAYLDASNPQEGLGTLLNAAITADPKSVAKIKLLLEDLISKLPVDDAVQASAMRAEMACYPGTNEVAKAIAYLSDKQPGFSRLDWGTQNFQAGEFLRRVRTSERGASEYPVVHLAAAPAEAPARPHLAAIAAYPGANDVERARMMLCDKQPGFARRSWHEQCYLAGRYVTTGVAQ